MAYARFSKECDVYVIRHIEDPSPWVCMACALDNGKSFVAESRVDMVNHLVTHERQGQGTGNAINRLAQELEAGKP